MLQRGRDRIGFNDMRTQRTQIIIYCKVMTTISDSYNFFSSNICSMPSLDCSDLHSNRNHFVWQRIRKIPTSKCCHCSDLKSCLLFQDRNWRMKSKSKPEPEHRTDGEKKNGREERKKIKFNCSNVTKYLDFLWLKWKDIKTFCFGLRTEGILHL